MALCRTTHCCTYYNFDRALTPARHISICSNVTLKSAILNMAAGAVLKLNITF
jgi:hypothetical protein